MKMKQSIWEKLNELSQRELEEYERTESTIRHKKCSKNSSWR
jgi:hypothetical protein